MEVTFKNKLGLEAYKGLGIITGTVECTAGLELEFGLKCSIL